MGDLYTALAEAEALPSRGYRNLEAALGAVQGIDQGFQAHDARLEAKRQRALKQMKLEDILGNGLGGVTLEQAQEGTKPLEAYSSYLRATKNNSKPAEDPMDAELRRELIQARIDSLRRGRSANPLDDQLKRARIAEIGNKTTQQNNKLDTTFDLYEAAKEGLLSGLEGSVTGPVMGRIPAVTSAQQTAEGGVSAMAPVLKQIFRVAGEGTFTDRDQALLLQMVPTRADTPEARNNKIRNIDNIVRAKLGKGGESTNSGPRSFNSPEEAEASGYKGPAIIAGRRAVLH